MLKVIFLCTGNACRSQMAEAFARELSMGMIDAYSAGLMEVEIHPRAIAAMKEAGIDISGQKSKEIDPEFRHHPLHTSREQLSKDPASGKASSLAYRGSSGHRRH